MGPYAPSCSCSPLRALRVGTHQVTGDDRFLAGPWKANNPALLRGDALKTQMQARVAKADGNTSCSCVDCSDQCAPLCTDIPNCRPGLSPRYLLPTLALAQWKLGLCIGFDGAALLGIIRLCTRSGSQVAVLALVVRISGKSTTPLSALRKSRRSS